MNTGGEQIEYFQTDEGLYVSEETFSAIKSKCEEKGTTLSEVMSECGFSRFTQDKFLEPPHKIRLHRLRKITKKLKIKISEKEENQNEDTECLP